MKQIGSGAILKQAKARAFLVSSKTNIQYLTKLDISSGIILITARSLTLFTDGRYLEMAEKKTPSSVNVKDGEEAESVMKKVKECGFESEHVTVDQLRKWKRKFKNTKFVRRKGVVEHFRRQKDAQELKCFKRAQKITREMMRRMPSILKRNITEKEVAWKLEQWARELGAEGLAFDPIVAFGTNSSSPHHKATNRKLKKGHIVQIDVGAQYKGYCADQSAVFFTAKPTREQKRVYQALLKAQTAAIDVVKPGITNHKLDSVARDILKEEGIEKYFTHALGHGVGLDIHEGISISQKAPKEQLLKNEIITIEPGVYFPGKWGMRVEEETVV